MFEEKQDQIDLLNHQLETERQNLAESQKAVADLKEELAIALETQRNFQNETEQIKTKQRAFTDKMQQL